MGFSIQSTLRFAWETFRKRPRLFIGATLLLFVANIVIEVIGRALDGLSANLDAAPLLAVAILSIAIYLAFATLWGMGVTAFGLAAHDNPHTAELSALWHPDPFWKFLGLILLYFIPILAMALLVGLIGAIESERVFVATVLFLGMFAVVLMLLFIFAGFFVIDREIGPIEALKESYRVTNGHWWSILGLVLLLILINSLGTLAFFLGFLLSLPGMLLILVLIAGLLSLVVTVPVALLAFTHAYRVLSGTTGAPPDEAMDAKLAA